MTRPVQMGARAAKTTQAINAVASLDRDMEYRLTRQDLWRLTIVSVICFALMIGVLFFLEG